MKNEKLRRAIGGIDADLIEAADQNNSRTGKAFVHRRIPRAALIAVLLAAVLSLSVMAYEIVHANVVRLMEAGAMTNGRVPVTIDETGRQIIDSSAIGLNLSQTSNDTTVTIDSAMGFRDLSSSMLYLTLRITPPEGYAFPEDMKDWCFETARIAAVPDDIQMGRVESTIKNPDGSASMLMLFLPNGDLENHSLHMDLEGFGMASKETYHEIFEGARTIELPGNWTFNFTVPTLPETQEIPFDAASVKEAGLPMTALRLNSFGGVAVLEKQELSRLRAFRETYGAQLKADFPTVDFDLMDDAEFTAICAGGDLDGFLTEAEFTHLQSLLDAMPRLDSDLACPKDLTLEYPDGSKYTVSFGETGDNLWINWDDDRTPYCQIVFTNPQPISNANAVVINGIRIPLK